MAPWLLGLDRLTSSAGGNGAVDDRLLSLPDGRSLGYREFGDPHGTPVIALHGTPGSRLKYSGSHEAAAQSGLRLIALDRWGYGLSSDWRGRQIARYADDVTALVNSLGIGRFQITGVSGGGPFAVATAAALGDRVTALALVSPVGLIAGPDGFAKLSPFHSLCFRILPRVPGALFAVFHAQRFGLAVAPKLAMSIAVLRSSEADRQAMRKPQIRAQMTQTFASGLQPGVAGAVCDMALFGRPWGFDFSGVRAATRIWIGDCDRNVPMTAVRALSAALPGCELIEIPGAGHLWVAEHAHAVMDWLAERAAIP